MKCARIPASSGTGFVFPVVVALFAGLLLPPGASRPAAAAPDQVAAAPDQVAGAPDQVAAAPDQVAAAPDQVAGAPGQVAGAPGQGRAQSPQSASEDDQAPRFRLPTITVTAQKEPADPDRLAVSVSTVTAETLFDAGISVVDEAATYVPNVFFSELTARKISNPRFRGIGSSPANPGISTVIDGVPQLNTNSSNIDLLQIQQIEFVRGPQSALFGRNSLGGVINITSSRPSLSEWSGSLWVPVGSDSTSEVQADVAGPLMDGRLGAGLSLKYADRDGFTRNVLTGHDLDSRSAFSAKGQFFWVPADNWEARLILSGERARDGDYALNDLETLRSAPFEVARDYEGFTDRDVFATTILTRRVSRRFVISTATGFVNWKTTDSTDLDYTALPFAVRENDEESFQFTQEWRIASAPDTTTRVWKTALRWQGGLFVFRQNYDQDAVNIFQPFTLSPFITMPVDQHSPQSQLDDWGAGFYGQTTTSLGSRIDVSVGARVDYERKEALLQSFFEPPLLPPTTVEAGRSFSKVSPQYGITYRFQPDRHVYATFGRGFKAGGFNPAAPLGSDAYLEETAWHFETGLKALWARGRLATTLAAFTIDWSNLQLNLPNPQVLGQFYIANVGHARSRGFELEITARPRPDVDVFATFGYTKARFRGGTRSNGVDVGGNRLPNTPEYTASLGTQVSRPLPLRRTARVYGRLEALVYGSYEYDDANTVGQSAYGLVNVRIGVREGNLFSEFWMRNALDRRYVPIAFAFGGFAPSGFVGEMGPPRTFGVRSGVSF